MAVSLQTQWTLVAAGLVAHADRVLAGEECERLMALVDDQVDEEDYSHWMNVVGDPAQLEGHLKTLAKPPGACHREILEEAWLMAIVDGERAHEELEALRRVGSALGIEPAQLESWREAWTATQTGYADVAVATLAWVLGGGAPVSAAARAAVDDFVHALPATHEHRESLLAAGHVPVKRDELEPRLRELGRPQQRDLLRRLGAVVGDAHAEEILDRLRALDAELGSSSAG